MSNGLRGLDPRLRGLIDKVAPHFYVQKDEAAALVLAHSKLDEKLLKKNGATHIARLTENIWSIRFDPNRVGALQSLRDVAYIEAGARLFPMLTRSVAGIKARPEDLEAGVDGREVVVGIVDYGIDWTLPDFCDETGERTRIKYLWDQSLTPNGAEKPPEDFAHGVEYSEQRINLALDAWRGGNRAQALSIVRHRPRPERDEDATDIDGHGTHVSGIACGNGASSSANCVNCRRSPSSPGYVGVAPKAWIVFVHLSRRRILSHVGGVDDFLGNSAELAEAIAYCYRKAEALSEQLGKRVACVVNLSMGFNGGSHDGESLVERVIDTMLEGKGRALVVAAGNQRQQRTYYTAAVQPGTPCSIAWKMGLGATADTTLNEMEIWYPSKHVLNVALINPQGSRSETAGPGQRLPIAFGDILGVIDSEQLTPLNGEARIYLQVTPGNQHRLEGTWTVELTSACREVVAFDAWIEKEAGIGFADEDPRQSKFDGLSLPQGQRVTSLTVPATARRAIAVGAVGNLDVLTPSPYQYSGTGPTRDGRLKPELVAPGVDICSNAVRFDRYDGPECAQVQKTGTSMAAPHVAGVVALMFQLNPELTSAQVKQILIASAEYRGGLRDFDPQWGFGVLNAQRALQLVAQTLQS
jgi:subtilisin family serine protease